ncbi:MAG: L-glutamate gamma-semialdehyde dehydrogenase [Desulfobacterium sp.]|jgi:1-pyrroline-5-carboxylate dehydrogenase|nr:L-glutamate gamma-semialdehyde dehydrogenase [Desulfobacterium sp.]
MSNAIFSIDTPKNEPVLTYGPGSPERKELKITLETMRADRIEIPLVIGGKEVKTGKMGTCRIPHDHSHILASYHMAGEKEVKMAADAAKIAAKEWLHMPWQDRLAIFRKVADLISGPYRMRLNAATMLGQGKNAMQAEIDAACELIDFLRFNTYYATQIYKDQPVSDAGIWNQLEYRPLEGFVFAISPFNFTAIAGNLCSSPAMMGNTVLWKPASTAVYSGHLIMEIFKKAGVPDGVINFIPGSGADVGTPAINHPDFAGVHFTGSTRVFRNIWTAAANNLELYGSYPRIVGETGGKDFIFVHESADVDAVSTAMIRGAFEYQGQKCSAASRAYVPSSMWKELKEKLTGTMATIKMGSPEDFSNFVNAVIDKNAFDTISGYIDFAKNSDDADIIAGGGRDDSVGYFVEPTVIVAKKPDFKTMEEEIFGPVLTIYVYEDADYDKTLELCDSTSEYALTGAIFATDRAAVLKARKVLTHAAGNFYINDKPTGAVVGQQPFGGARASGTNDKAGSPLNLYRWVSARTVKETFVPPTDYRYPFMD